MATFTLSPSDFAWLYDQCKRCWYLKLHRFAPAKDSLPKVFRTIDGAMKQAIDVDTFRALGIPAVERMPATRVVSKPLTFAGATVIIRAELDRLLRLEDDTFGLIEFKSGQPGEPGVQRYSRQCHGYELALRCPETGDPIEISRIDLCYFDATSIGAKVKDGRLSLYAALTAQSVPIDRAGFEAHLAVMARIAGSDTLPPPGQRCHTCGHVAARERFINRRFPEPPPEEPPSET